MNLVFLSFADKRYKDSLKRIESETAAFPFNKRYFFNEDILCLKYIKKIKPKINRRGYGYWMWKPYVVKKIFDTLNYGDILFYSDSGTFWNIKGLLRFNEYVKMIENSSSGILVFQQPYLEKDWTKGDIFDELSCYLNDEIMMSLQLWAGTFGILKNKMTIRLIDQWLDLAKQKPDLFTDKESFKRNLQGFQENRHDQSVFSVLVKQVPHLELSWKEIDSLDCLWKDSKNYPIQAKRLNKNNKKNICEILIKLIKYPFLLMIGLYLKYIMHYHFNNKISW